MVTKNVSAMSFKVAANVFGLGEVAEPEAKQNYKILKLKTNVK